MASNTTSRRDMLKKTAVAGAVVWTVPTLTATPAFAAGSLSTNLCPGEITSITYTWQWRDLQWDVCNTDGTSQPKSSDAKLTGSAIDPAITTVRITAYRDGGNNSTHLVNGAQSADVNFGGQFTITGKLAPNSVIVISDLSGNVLQTIRYHFSCSQPLCFGDRHGSLLVNSYTVA